jgi:SOS-response transcriptional repressor LexA
VPNALTPIQRQALRFLRQYVKRHGYSPTVREVAFDIERSASSAHTILKALEEKGYVTGAIGPANRGARTIRPVMEAAK